MPLAPVALPSGGSDAAVVVTGLVKRYGSREALRGVDLSAPSGAVTALLGPNGAGKTTTVECCEGLRRSDGGVVRVLGLDPVRDRRRLRARVGVMLQDGGLPGTVPAGEALRHVAAMYAEPWDPRELTTRLGLTGVVRTPVRRLSGGERQRLALAAALVGRPEVVFLDEPSAGMDPQSRHAVWDLVRELRAAGTSIVLTTHQMAEAEELADHVVVVDHGRVVTSGTTRDLVAGVTTLRVTVRPATDAPSPTDEELVGRLGAALRAEVAPDVTVLRGAAPGTVEVRSTPTPHLVHAVTGWALTEGLQITSLSTGSRTLEDVFLDLTGRDLR